MSGIRLSHDIASFDLAMITEFVQGSYWGEGRRAGDIERAIRNCACVGLFEGAQQVGFARAMTDGVFSAYIYDVFVLPPWRGQGLSRQLVQGLFDHPDLATVTGWTLATRDAHALYEKFGFAHAEPGRFMTLTRSRTRSAPDKA